MKKTYISPKTDIVSVELQKMIAASEPITLTEEGGSGQLIDTPPSGTNPTVLSRGSSLWDDDEE